MPKKASVRDFARTAALACSVLLITAIVAGAFPAGGARTAGSGEIFPQTR